MVDCNFVGDFNSCDDGQMTSQEAAVKYGVSVRTVTWWCRTGKLKAVLVSYPIPHWVIRDEKRKKTTWFGGWV